ncbi:molybdopterin-dependent oxidoreductase [Zhongshania sp. CAU 1632]|uniref:Molybdopterin-dependent oxidoreductase n=2 Tax=Zhongshania aquimaris TaxID=2857107 RepID=A0ABS6VXK1_9GAMM|nr:molybdopterin-dependent oxidoreductase [Zhongshania aquimaris]MBW2942764.1 molybdopterin-dependent oxidoreductase [Zhongshania aquimaris]
MRNTVKSFCRNCSALCSMNLEVENNKIIAVTADGSVSPYGAYMCAKGRASVDFHNGEGRILNSLKRDEVGDLQPIDVEDALDEIAAKLSALIAQYGPRSIALYHGTGAYRSVLGSQLEKSFLSAIGTPNLFSTMTIDQSAKWVTMGRMGVMASGKPAFADVDLAVIVGNNPVVTHQTYPFSAGESGAPAKSYLDAKKRGFKMIVIDPRKTETARLADLVIQPLPGQDAAVFAAIAHILLRDGTYNKAFCSQFVSQLDELRIAVEGFTPELAARRADVPVAQIELAAKWIAEAKRPFVGSGTGPSMSLHSNLNDHMIEVVNALVGGYRRAGDKVRNPGTLNPRKFVEMAVAPSRSWERGVKCHSTDIGQLFGEFPTALLPQEIMTKGPDKIRALIVFGGDPVMALGDPTLALPAFEDLDLLVSLDARVNETGKLSHYVIASSQPFERHEISIPGESLYPEAFAQYALPAVTKPAGVIDDWQFFWALAARMELQLTLKYWSYGLRFDDIEDGLELTMDKAPEPSEMIRFLCRKSRVPFEVLRDNPSGVRPDLTEQFVESAMVDNGARLQLCPSDVATELASLLTEEETPQNQFPFYLTSRRILEAMNSAFRDSARTRKKYPVNWAYMNPDDMAQLVVLPETAIEVTSEFGCIRALVKADPGLRRGVVSMTHMFGLLNAKTKPLSQAGSYTGQLTSLQKYLEPINFMPRFSGVPVAVSVDEIADEINDQRH